MPRGPPLSRLGSPPLRYEVTYGRNEFLWDFHHSLFGFLESGFIFCNCFIISLLFVMSQHLANPFFVPAWWKLGLSHLFPFRRRRR